MTEQIKVQHTVWKETVSKEKGLLERIGTKTNKALLGGLITLSVLFSTACSNNSSKEYRKAYNKGVDIYNTNFTTDYNSAKKSYELAEKKYKEFETKGTLDTPNGVAAQLDYERAKKQRNRIQKANKEYRITLEELQKKYDKARKKEGMDAIKEPLNEKNTSTKEAGLSTFNKIP